MNQDIELQRASYQFEYSRVFESPSMHLCNGAVRDPQERHDISFSVQLLPGVWLAIFLPRGIIIPSWVNGKLSLTNLRESIRQFESTTFD